jgi:uncharacterized alpha-E superfamily protein
MPRSLAFCYRSIAESLRHRAEEYEARHPCHDTAEATLAKLKVGSIKEVFDGGLHEFLDAFIRDNNRLGDQVAESNRFY